MSRVQDPWMSSHMEMASRRYPEDNPEVALQKYVVDFWISGVQFIYKGARYVIAGSILHYRDKRRCTGKLEFVTGAKNRLFVNKLERPTNLQRIDFVTKKTKSIRKFFRHCSEDQWNLPRDHEHHLLNFPPEILDQILKCALALPGGFLVPMVVTSNWKRVYSEPHYDVSFPQCNDDYPHYRDIDTAPKTFDQSLRPLMRRSLRDQKGPYTALTRILRPAIDATLLRTSKALHGLGSEVLYGQNKFIFNFGSPDIESSPPSYIGKSSYLPNPNRPIISNDLGENEQVTRRPIRQIQRKAPIKSIPGWCYYDGFIRFLYHIRPHNATHIKILRFPGTVMTHVCHESLDCNRCYQKDLVSSLRLYIPFINHFCTGLRELILDVSFDSDDQLPDAERQAGFDERFGMFLESGIRELKTVRVLIIVPEEFEEPQQPAMNIHVAAKTVQWFKERAFSWTKE